MRLVLASIALSLSSVAHAGGLGLLTTAGFRTDTVYFYDAQNDMEQWSQVQTPANVGAGLEVLLGDRDDRAVGLVRAYWLQDAPQKDPATITTVVPAEHVVSNYREDPRQLGIATFGVQWGLFGEPEGFQVVAVTSAGAGYLTTDHTEFALGEFGGGATYRFAGSLQAFADVDYSVRYRKTFSHGANVFLGVRYLFD